MTSPSVVLWAMLPEVSAYDMGHVGRPRLANHLLNGAWYHLVSPGCPMCNWVNQPWIWARTPLSGFPRHSGLWSYINPHFGGWNHIWLATSRFGLLVSLPFLLCCEKIRGKILGKANWHPGPSISDVGRIASWPALNGTPVLGSRDQTTGKI